MNELAVREKIGYGLGDFASSMFWKIFSIYLLFFYTDVFGITAAAAGSLFLVTRIWDTALDPLIGIVADRTTSRWGKFRPYLLWTSVPFGIIGILTFTTPDFSASGKLVYAYITYTLMMMTYSVINVPYASLLGVMTPDIKERTTLSTFRFVFAFAGSLLVLATAEPLVDLFSMMLTGVPDLQKGWQYTMVVFAIIAGVLFYLTFRWTRERVHPSTGQPVSLASDLRDLVRNKPWFILLGAGVCTLVFNSLRDGSAIYYFRYYFRDQQAFQLPLNISLNYSTLYLVLGQAANIVGVILAKPVSDMIGKKKSFLYAMLCACILSAGVYLAGEDDLLLIFVLQFCISVCAGSIFPLLWSMYADIADYSEWQTGRRATGLIFSSSSMSQKLGWTLGGALTGWLLAFWGFEANEVQGAEAKNGIRLMLSIIPATGALLSAGFMMFYKLNDSFMITVSRELQSRRSNI